MNIANGWLGAGLVAALLTTNAATAAQAIRTPFGTLADGRAIEAVTLSNNSGLTVRVITLGALIQSLQVPDQKGHSEDIVLGFETAQEYLVNGGYFGATVGRFANRIAHARFSLDGQDYTLIANDHGNSLHGGPAGFDKAVWQVDTVSGGALASAVFSYRSRDGEQGYPGNLQVTANYSLDEHSVLRIDFAASSDKRTIVNISNHSYFNLSGAGHSALNHLLMIDAARYTPVDASLIPTGELREVQGTAFDFRTPTLIGARVRDARDPQLRFGRGYDHNFVLNGKAGEMRVAAQLSDPTSGRLMTIATDAPGLQFYSGNFLDATIHGKEEQLYREGDAVVLEPQIFPDAPNQTGFAASGRLDPGKIYHNRIEYRFSIADSSTRRH